MVVFLEHDWMIFPLGRIIPIDELIFVSGVGIPPTRGDFLWDDMVLQRCFYGNTGIFMVVYTLVSSNMADWKIPELNGGF